MSDIKKIKDEYLAKLNKDQNLESINQIKTELFGKNGIVSNEFKKMGSKEIRELGKPKHILYDLKHVLPKDDVDIRL